MPKNKKETDHEFETKLMDIILEKGGLKNIIKLVITHKRKNWKSFLLKKVNFTSDSST